MSARSWRTEGTPKDQSREVHEARQRRRDGLGAIDNIDPVTHGPGALLQWVVRAILMSDLQQLSATAALSDT